jgi:hypothetical protein
MSEAMYSQSSHKSLRIVRPLFSSTVGSHVVIKTLFISITLIFLTSYLYSYGPPSVPQILPVQPETLSREEWIAAALETEIDDPLDISDLRDLCNAKQWRKGLVFDCPRPAGGVGNVRNKVLTCVRYAIEAGGK